MRKIIKISAIAIGLLILIGIILGLSSSDGQKNLQNGREDGRKSVETSSSKKELTSLEQMEVSFVNNPSKNEIKEKLDRALTLYKTEISEENYSRAGSTLVSLRKESKTGVTEMQILDYMISSYVENVNMSFPDMAAISFSALEANANRNN